MAEERDNSKFAELIEACRPGSADLQEGEMAAARERVASDAAALRHYQRVQRSDTRLAMAFHDVPVPEGLAERLLAALDAAAPANSTASVIGEEIAHPTPSAPAHVELPPRRPWRRPVLKLTIAAALLALVGGGLALLSNLTPYSSQQCVAQAAQAVGQLPADGWQNMRSAPPWEKRLPVTRFRATPKSWQSTTLLGDKQAVAYRYSNGATLIVCQPSKTVSALPNAPPSTPQQKAATSSGTHVAAWTSGGLVHVLVISGPIREYRHMTDTSPPVIAQFCPQSLRDRYNG